MLKLIQIQRIVSKTKINILGATNLRLFSDEKKIKNVKNNEQDDKKVDLQKPKVAIDRLNSLLSNMSSDSSSTKVNMTKIGIAGRQKQTNKQQKIDSDSDSDNESPNQNIVHAARNVARKLGGNEEKTEAELLSKLISHSDQIHEISKEQKSTMNLNDLIVGMKVEKEPISKSQQRGGKSDNFVHSDRAQSVKKSMGFQNTGRSDMRKKEFKRKPSETSPSGSVNLFASQPLSIFKVDQLIESNDPLSTWSHLEKNELNISNPPSNYFEKMILWSEQNKVWKFPINNEQGLDTEAHVDFSEHIFLEEHLEGWCPTKGPIKHFMELVCVGLSKNPYISAKEKKDHIMWFRDYFEEKKDLLSEVIMMDKDSKANLKKIGK